MLICPLLDDISVDRSVKMEFIRFLHSELAFCPFNKNFMERYFGTMEIACSSSNFHQLGLATMMIY